MTGLYQASEPGKSLPSNPKAAGWKWPRFIPFDPVEQTVHLGGVAEPTPEPKEIETMVENDTSAHMTPALTNLNVTDRGNRAKQEELETNTEGAPSSTASEQDDASQKQPTLATQLSTSQGLPDELPMQAETRVGPRETAPHAGVQQGDVPLRTSTTSIEDSADRYGPVVINLLEEARLDLDLRHPRTAVENGEAPETIPSILAEATPFSRSRLNAPRSRQIPSYV